MKRYIIIMIAMLAGLVAMAKPPHLNVEKLFDGSYNSNKNVSINISKKNGEYYRGFSVKDNAALVKKVTELFKKDADQADEAQDIIEGGGITYSSMQIKNNNQKIYIGISYSPGHYPGSDDCYLFIKGRVEAFK